jgi:hypothetical protein
VSKAGFSGVWVPFNFEVEEETHEVSETQAPKDETEIQVGVQRFWPLSR